METAPSHLLWKCAWSPHHGLFNVPVSIERFFHKKICVVMEALLVAFTNVWNDFWGRPRVCASFRRSLSPHKQNTSNARAPRAQRLWLRRNYTMTAEETCKIEVNDMACEMDKLQKKTENPWKVSWRKSGRKRTRFEREAVLARYNELVAVSGIRLIVMTCDRWTEGDAEKGLDARRDRRW